MSGLSLKRGPERPLSESIKLEEQIGNSKMLEMPELGYLLKKAVEHVWNQQKRNVLQSIKVKEVGELKNVLTSGIEKQNLRFALMAFSLALIQYLLTLLCFL